MFVGASSEDFFFRCTTLRVFATGCLGVVLRCSTGLLPILLLGDKVRIDTSVPQLGMTKGLLAERNPGRCFATGCLATGCLDVELFGLVSVVPFEYFDRCLPVAERCDTWLRCSILGAGTSTPSIEYAANNHDISAISGCHVIVL